MSDWQAGPDWWQASDGKWYAPELRPPDPVPPTEPLATVSGVPVAAAKRPLHRRPWFIVVAAVVVLIAIASAVGGKKRSTTVRVANGAATTTTRPTSEATTTTVALVTTAVPVVTAPTTMAVPTTFYRPAVTPTTRAPAPPPTAPPVTQPPTTAAVNFCGAPSNPMGYNFCGRGTYISTPDPRTCNYFNCIASFANGVGYMEECNDGTYSMSGGRSGACSHHGGEQRPVSSGP